MIVLDASALVELLLNTPTAEGPVSGSVSRVTRAQTPTLVAPSAVDGIALAPARVRIADNSAAVPWQRAAVSSAHISSSRAISACGPTVVAGSDDTVHVYFEKGTPLPARRTGITLLAARARSLRSQRGLRPEQHGPRG